MLDTFCSSHTITPYTLQIRGMSPTGLEDDITVGFEADRRRQEKRGNESSDRVALVNSPSAAVSRKLWM